MGLGEETFELDLTAKALRAISKEISYGGLAEALLEAAFEYSGAARGAVLLSEGGELVTKADASFPREKQRILVSRPPFDEFGPPSELEKRVVPRRETVISREGWPDFVLAGPAERPPKRDVVFLCLPLVHQQRTIGVLTIKDGRGIGLSICRKIIRTHGGRLWAEQNANFGATFTFTVPTRQSPHCPESK
jgi:GAF domain-containing protein